MTERTLLTAQQIADETATLIARELRSRDIPVRLGGTFKTAEEIVGHRIWPLPGFYSVGVIQHPTSQDLLLSLADFSAKWLRATAAEMGIKLARPYPLETFDLEMPLGLDYRAISNAHNVSLRVLRGFDIGASEFSTRFDMLVRWQEAAP